MMEKHAALCLEWAKAHRHWTKEDWKRVIWSDKCAVKKDNEGRLVWVFRHQNKQEKYKRENIRGKEKYSSVSQMIWGYFIDNKLGSIAFINGTVNKHVYVEILREAARGMFDMLGVKQTEPVTA